MSDEEKIETCFLCGKKFDMNKSELAYYRYDKYPIVITVLNFTVFTKKIYNYF